MEGYLTKEEINIIEERIGYTFKNKDLLSRAFRRRSFTTLYRFDTNIDLPDNETLEFYGDSALNIIVVKNLAQMDKDNMHNNKLSNYTEEKLSNFISHTTDKMMLSNVIEKLDISKYLIMSKGDILQEAYKSISVMEDLFESIVGAMWFDSDLDINAIEEYVLKMLNLNINDNNLYDKDSYRLLRELIDQNPGYELVKDGNIYCLKQDGAIIQTIECELFPKCNNLINISQSFIDIIQKREFLNNKKIVDTSNVSYDNAINKLQELAQKKIISSLPQYSKGDFDYERGIWHMDCIYNYKIIHTASAKSKMEAKKLAAYDMYMDLANRINN